MASIQGMKTMEISNAHKCVNCGDSLIYVGRFCNKCKSEFGIRHNEDYINLKLWNAILNTSRRLSGLKERRLYERQ